MSRVEEALTELHRKLSREELAELVTMLDGVEVRPNGEWRLVMAGRTLADGEGMQSVLLEHANIEDATGLSIVVYHGSADGVPVVQIDGDGQFRVNVNDGPIWVADPNSHEHEQCKCVKAYEEK